MQFVVKCHFSPTVSFLITVYLLLHLICKAKSGYNKTYSEQLSGDIKIQCLLSSLCATLSPIVVCCYLDQAPLPSVIPAAAPFAPSVPWLSQSQPCCTSDEECWKPNLSLPPSLLPHYSVLHNGHLFPCFTPYPRETHTPTHPNAPPALLPPPPVGLGALWGPGPWWSSIYSSLCALLYWSTKASCLSLHLPFFLTLILPTALSLSLLLPFLMPSHFLALLFVCAAPFALHSCSLSRSRLFVTLWRSIRAVFSTCEPHALLFSSLNGHWRAAAIVTSISVENGVWNKIGVTIHLSDCSMSVLPLVVYATQHRAVTAVRFRGINIRPTSAPQTELIICFSVVLCLAHRF